MTAEIYPSRFDPATGLVSNAIGKVKPGMPVLYVAPTGDYPAFPANPLSRLHEPEFPHLMAPDAATEEILRWITQVAN